MATKARHLKTPIQLWVADQRKAGGYSSQDLADWTGVVMDTARGWESRGRPSEDALDILERKFGVKAPRDLADAPPVDQFDLASAIRDQTKAITDLVGLLRPLVESHDQRVKDLAVAVGLLTERALQGDPVPVVQPETTG
jgi:hypothetical protein